MMIWVYSALLATCLVTAVNFIDKYVIGKRLHDSSPLTYLAISGIFGTSITAVLGVFAGHSLLASHLGNNLLALGAGLLFAIGIGSYYKALSQTDTSLTASLFQLIIVWNLFFGYLFLDEKPTLWAVFGMALLILSSLYFAHSVDIDGRRKFHKQVFWTMAWACLLISLSDVLFKSSVTNHGSFIVSQLFEYAAFSLVGIVLFMFSKKVRSECKPALRQAPILLPAIVLGSECINFGGTILGRLSLVHLKISVAQAIMGVQPLLLVLAGYVLTRLWPATFSESLLRKHVLGKIAAACCIIIAEVLIVTLGA